MRLYIVRHAQSANNALAHPSLTNPERDSDPSLTETGFKQTECVARFLKEEYGDGNPRCAVEHRIKRLYASPMRRCMLTATPIARELGVDINVRADIHEHGGCFEGSAEGEVVGRPGMGCEQLEREFPGCVVPRELEKGWWKESAGVETVEEVRTPPRAPKHHPPLETHIFPPHHHPHTEFHHKITKTNLDPRPPPDSSRTNSQAQTRIRGVVKWLWQLAETSTPKDGAVCIVVHGMFIDILCKQLAGAPMQCGKQTAMFCTNNAGTHVFELSVNDAGNIAGFLRFNQVEYIPVELQTGGSVDGLDECYMNEGSA